MEGGLIPENFLPPFLHVHVSLNSQFFPPGRIGPLHQPPPVHSHVPSLTPSLPPRCTPAPPPHHHGNHTGRCGPAEVPSVVVGCPPVAGQHCQVTCQPARLVCVLER